MHHLQLMARDKQRTYLEYYSKWPMSNNTFSHVANCLKECPKRGKSENWWTRREEHKLAIDASSKSLYNNSSPKLQNHMFCALESTLSASVQKIPSSAPGNLSNAPYQISLILER